MMGGVVGSQRAVRCSLPTFSGVRYALVCFLILEDPFWFLAL